MSLSLFAKPKDDIPANKQNPTSQKVSQLTNLKPIQHPTQPPTDLAAKVKAVVLAQTNGQVPEALLDQIIARVIETLGLNQGPK